MNDEMWNKKQRKTAEYVNVEGRGINTTLRGRGVAHNSFVSTLWHPENDSRSNAERKPEAGGGPTVSDDTLELQIREREIHC